MSKLLMIAIILTSFSTPAFAQSGGFGGLESLLPLILIGGVAFFIIRKVNKKSELKEQKEKEILDEIDSRLKKLENKEDSL